MQSDSRSNLIRGLKNVATRHRRSMAAWLVAAVIVETVLFDIVCQFVQFAVTGQSPRCLFVPSQWLGLESGTAFIGSYYFRASLLAVFLLGLRTMCLSLRDEAVDATALSIVAEIRSRLFRETHRTSGTLIAPDVAEGTIDLIDSQASDYGRSVAEAHRNGDNVIVRLIFGFLILAAIRIDFAVILACAAVLFRLLERSVRKADEQERAAQSLESERLSHALREELREAYQARAIGAEMGQDRPSGDCLNRLTRRHEEFAHNLRTIVATRRWGQVAIVALTLLCLATRSASVGPTPFQSIALLTLGSFAAVFTVLERTSRDRQPKRQASPDSAPIDRIHQALTSSARIWDVSSPRILQPCRNGILVDQIPLAIRPQDPDFLRTLDILLPARRITAIVCPDAAYRSKLMRLLARWEDPESGRIEIDGVDLREFSIASTRLQIGTIRSDAYVNDGSVIENIVLNDPRANLSNIIDAAKAVHAHRMIQRLPNGYETLIDSDKPAGEQAYLRYLIALARGKWHDPSILIVEEPAAPMTRGMKELLRDAYRRLSQDRTVILFTRHAASVLAADQVVLIGRSRVITGQPDQLMATHNGFRRAMAEMGLGLKAKSRSKSKSRKRAARLFVEGAAKSELPADPGQIDRKLS